MLLLLLSIFLLTLGWLIKVNRTPNGLPLPPGPTGTWFYGVSKQLRGVVPWQQYLKWSEHFQSPIISFLVYNRRVVVLNDHVAVHDLLNKRTNIYSDRPKSWMYHDLCARGDTVFNISSLDPRHRQYRKMLQTGLSAHAMESYWPGMDAAARTLVEDFRRDPSAFQDHLRKSVVAIIMKVAYGYTITENDQFIRAAEELAKISGAAMAPGRWLVDYYPLLRFLPSWLPFHRQAQEWKEKLEYLSSIPFDWVKKQMASEKFEPSFTSRLLSNEAPKVNEDMVKWAGNGLYGGAADTVISAMISFVLLMAVYPAVQKKAQAEIDEVTDGRARQPGCADKADAVYLVAVMKEVLRYAPVANIALPHRATEEDEYRGYRIPKDATVIPNTWAIMRDASLYPEPHKFDPERFMEAGSAMPDPRTFAFGYGRRTCPGIQFAKTFLLLMMSTILSNYDIGLPVDSAPPEIDFTAGITSHVKPFKVTITSRSVFV
ncbi:cytochrome P450 [Cylindrobasidium torrendii FP15055 ss-10]|uniref:Cytochrome P450 n=1 Tax=Cylindrobasidium torrendii FP15055 ss-10 TaxID=1314674 RepID=A0A0D7B2I4_9AGAR|nr:cytochrome P450 [Cylindrobasidium torrendii FP15055 ss-10]